MDYGCHFLSESKTQGSGETSLVKRPTRLRHGKRKLILNSHQNSFILCESSFASCRRDDVAFCFSRVENASENGTENSGLIVCVLLKMIF